jgi:allantoinase
MTLDVVLKNVRVVRPDVEGVAEIDLGIVGGKFARIEPGIPAEDAAVVIDGGGKLAFPGIVDAHQHWGIYNPLARTLPARAAPPRRAV